MDEDIMEARLTEILNEYSLLPELEHWDLTLEAISKKGDVKAILKRGKHTIEREIGMKEDLSFVGDTFTYPATLSPRSKMPTLSTVKDSYYNDFGSLVIIHSDTTEIFKVSANNKSYISEKLKSLLGDRFNETYRPQEIIPKINPTHSAEMLFKVYFSINGQRDYIIVAGDTIDGIRHTADDVMSRRGLNVKDNDIFSERINN